MEHVSKIVKSMKNIIRCIMGDIKKKLKKKKKKK